ncbi:MAG TPA: hypothetical protein VFJ71_10050 [Candidatus Limnocylindrales bacterium]|nr:hypothetical protein [Candidatus Limnocylindrales bacterium]
MTGGRFIHALPDVVDEVAKQSAQRPGKQRGRWMVSSGLVVSSEVD